MNKIDFSRIFKIANILSLALIYPLLWVKMLADPAQYSGADFIAFYAAGRIADNEGAARAYDLNLQKKYQEEVVMREMDMLETFPYIHPPFVIPLAQIAATPDYLASFQRWAAFMTFIFAVSIPFLLAIVVDFFSKAQNIVLAVSLFLFFPVFQSILLGQDNALMFLGVSICLWGIFQKKDWAAGLGLTLTIVRPHFALFLLLPFIFQRRNSLGWFILFTFALTMFSLLYTGPGGLTGFLRILTVSGSGEGYRTNEENMINLIGFVRRTFPFLSSSDVRAAGWIFYALAFSGLGVYYWRRPESLETQISLASIVAVFFSPHSHVQDLILLIVPIMALVMILLEKKITPPSRVVSIPLVISIILLFSYYSPMLLHSTPYALMFGLLFAIWKYKNSPATP